MNKKLIGLITSGIIIIATGIELKGQIIQLEKIIQEVEIDNADKQKQINKLEEELNIKLIDINDLEKQIEEKNTDINILEEERKLYINEIEQLKKKTNYSQSKVIFNENNLKTKSGVDKNRLNRVLQGTGLEGLAGSYIQAEQDYGVNAIFLASLTALESDWGDSNRAVNQNNLSGYAVYSDTSVGKSFSSKHDSIISTARLLSNDYLNTNGKYYQGTDIYGVNSVYCPNDNFHWGNTITKIAYNLVGQINSL